MSKRKSLLDDLYNRAEKSQKEKIIILPELRDLIPPLAEDEFEQLATNILAEGCREPLLVWQKSPSALVLIDGHNRYRICQKHQIDFSWKIKQFPNLLAAKNWMIDNQLGRRNLKPEQTAYLRGLRYNTEKQTGFKGNQYHQTAKAQNEPKQNTADKLATEYGISRETIKRDARYSLGLDKLGRVNGGLKRAILSGGVKVKKSEIQQLSKLETEDLKGIKTVKDIPRILQEAKDRKKKKGGLVKAHVRRSSSEVAAAKAQRIEELRLAIQQLTPTIHSQKELKKLEQLIEEWKRLLG